MSELTATTLGRQPPFEVISRGERRGYTQKLIQARPVYTDIAVVDDRREAVNALVDHIVSILYEFKTDNLFGQQVAQVVIGKTYAAKKDRSVFSPTNPNTWKICGVSSRWNSKYFTEEYDALVVFECFSARDVPENLQIYHIDQQQYSKIFF